MIIVYSIVQEQSATLHERERVLLDKEQVVEEELQASLDIQDKATHHARKELMRRYAILQEVKNV